MAVTAVGALVSGTGVTTLSLNPTAVGNAYVLAVKLPSNTATVTSITGGSCTWTKIAGPLIDTSGTAHTHYMYLGVSTSTGSSTMTATLSTGTADLDAQQFTNNNTSTTWALDGSQDSLVNNASSTTVTWPSLTPANVGELYVGHARCPNGSSFSGITSGFTQQTDANSNPYIYGTISATTAPTLTSAATTSFAIGALVIASVAGQTISSVDSVPVNANAAGMSTFSKTFAAANDLVVGFIEIDPSTTITITSLTSSHATWTKIVDVLDADGKYFSLFYGITNAAATDTVTINFSASPGSSQVETGFQEFTSSRSSPTWSVDTSNYFDYGSGTTIVYPTLTPKAAGELYWAYGKTTATGSAGSTTGYSYAVVAATVNVEAWNVGCTSSAQSPTAVTTTGSGVSIAAMITDNTATPITSTDTASGADTGTIVGSIIATDTSVGAESTKVAVSSTGDTVSGTDNSQISSSDSDTVQGTESSTLAVVSTDITTSVDFGLVSSIVSVSDSFIGSDNSNQIASPLTDTINSTDTAQVSIRVSDISNSIDSSMVSTVIIVSDTGAGNETAQIRLYSSDTCSFVDTSSFKFTGITVPQPPPTGGSMWQLLVKVRVTLPDGYTYSPGQIVVLTTTQYAKMSKTQMAAVTVIGTAASVSSVNTVNSQVAQESIRAVTSEESLASTLTALMAQVNTITNNFPISSIDGGSSASTPVFKVDGGGASH